MEKPKWKWQMIVAVPRGHRFFLHVTSGDAVAVADASGSTPDKTDDGVLWIDPDDKRPFRVNAESGTRGTVVDIPLVHDSSSGFGGRNTMTSDPLCPELENIFDRFPTKPLKGEGFAGTLLAAGLEARRQKRLAVAEEERKKQPVTVQLRVKENGEPIVAIREARYVNTPVSGFVYNPSVGVFNAQRTDDFDGTREWCSEDDDGETTEGSALVVTANGDILPMRHCEAVDENGKVVSTFLSEDEDED